MKKRISHRLSKSRLIISKKLILSVIAGLLLFGFFVFYYYKISSYHISQPTSTSTTIVQSDKRKEDKSPTPTSSPTEKPLPTVKAENTPIVSEQWKFSNNEYEVSIENINYYQVSDSEPAPIGGRIRFSYDLVIKNLSVTPFIIGYQISDCIVTKDSVATTFTVNYGSSFDKGVLPGEILRTKIDSGFWGKDYDSSGNPISPSPDLKIKECKIQLKTHMKEQGILLYKVTEPAPDKQWLVEPKIIQFSN